MRRVGVLLLCAAGCGQPVETAERAGAALITAAAELSVPRPANLSATPGAQRAAVVRPLPGMGSGYLVLWEDSRRGELDLYSATIDGTNASLLHGPTLVAGLLGNQHQVVVECSPAVQSCFAVWADEPSGLLHGAQLDAEGKVVGTARSLVPRTLDRQHEPSLVWLSSDNYVLAWTESRNAQSDLEVAIISGTPTGANAARYPIEKVPTRVSRTPQLAIGRNAGTSLFLVWEEAGRGVVGTRLNPSTLEPANDPPLAISAPGSNDAGVAWPLVQSSPTGFQFVWGERRMPDWDLYWAQLLPDGGVSPSRALAARPFSDQVAPALSGSYVVWADNRGGDWDIYGSALAAGTLAQESPIFTGGGDQELPAVHAEATTAVTVWTDGRGLDGFPDVYASRFAVPFGSGFLSRELVSAFPAESQSVAVATQRGVDLVAWQDTRDPNASSELYGMFVVDGRPDAGFPLVLGPGPQEQPAAAAGPSGEFLVAYADGPTRSIKSVQVGGAATATAPRGLSDPGMGETHAQPAAVWNGAHYTVFYTQRPAWQLHALVYDPGVAGMVPDLTVGGAGGQQQEPAAAATPAGDVLVAWTEKNAAGLDVWARRFNRAGSPVDGPLPLPIAVGLGEQSEPAVATDGRDFIVVWRDSRGVGSSNLWGLRVPAAAGAAIDAAGVQLTDGPGIERRPRVAFDGKEWVVSWEDDRDASNGGAAVWAERVASDLSHYAPERVAPGVDPALSIGAASTGLIGYHRLTPSASMGTLARQVLMKRVLAPGGTPCVTDTDCQSGSCALAVCAAFDAGRPMRFDAGVIGLDGGGVIPPEITEDALATAVVGRPYAYNTQGRVGLEHGTLPVAFGTCDTPPASFGVDPMTGEVKWTPDTTGPVDLCVFATNGLRDEYRFAVEVTADPAAQPPNATLLSFQTQTCACGTSSGLLLFAALFSLFKKTSRRNKVIRESITVHWSAHEADPRRLGGGSDDGRLRNAGGRYRWWR